MIKVVLAGATIVIAIFGLFKLMKGKSENNSQKSLDFEMLKFSDIIKLANEFVKEGNLENKKIVLVKSNESEFVLTLFDSEKNEIVGDRTKLIKAKAIDESLKIAFGDKDMLILE